MDKLIVTKDGLEKLQAEYKNLKEKIRPEVIEELQRSRELGDLSENGAYHAAREKQSFVEGRIKELEDILKNVEVVRSAKRGYVTVGSKVKLKLSIKGSTKAREFEYTIVGHGESDLKTNKIAHDSPLGEALMGRSVNDNVTVATPSGTMQYTITEID